MFDLLRSGSDYAVYDINNHLLIFHECEGDTYIEYIRTDNTWTSIRISKNNCKIWGDGILIRELWYLRLTTPRELVLYVQKAVIRGEIIRAK